MTKLPLTAMLLVALAAGDPCATIDKNGTCLAANRSLFCVNHHIQVCAKGTICDPSFHALHPKEAPCIDIMQSYGCNRTTWKCEQTLGISSLDNCENTCYPTPPPTPWRPTPPTPPPPTPSPNPKPSPKPVPTYSPNPKPSPKPVPSPRPSPAPRPGPPSPKPVPTPPTPPAPTIPPTPNCGHVEDFECVSDKGFCRSRFYFPCSQGTKCSETFHRHHPNDSPCIGPEDAYECNRETLQCVAHGGYQSLSECEETCKATPAPTPAPEPRDCEDVPRFKCLSKHGYCRNHVYITCPRQFECSDTFHSHHPFQNPCIDPESSWSCNRETSQCLKNTGTMDRLLCEEKCKIL